MSKFLIKPILGKSKKKGGSVDSENDLGLILVISVYFDFFCIQQHQFLQILPGNYEMPYIDRIDLKLHFKSN